MGLAIPTLAELLYLAISSETGLELELTRESVGSLFQIYFRFRSSANRGGLGGVLDWKEV